MARHDHRFSSPAVERARARAEERARARHAGDTGRKQGDRVDLKVLADEIGDGVDVKEVLPASWVTELVNDNKEIRWTGHEDGRVDVRLERESAFVRMRGEARFSLLHPCVRCGQRDVPFEMPLKMDLRLVERSQDDAIEADFEGFNDGDDHAGFLLGNAADLEDIDVASYVGNDVAVDAILREQLFLELPAHPNCESGGACLQGPCGLTEQQAALEAETSRFIDPRWAGLLALKAKLGDAPAPAPGVDGSPASSSTSTAAKKTAKKAAATKKTAKKTATKKTTKKAAKKKTATKKTATKKTATKKTAKTTATKKTAKKAAAKKTAKKAAAKKTAAKTTATKKTAAKKTARKKAAPQRRA